MKSLILSTLLVVMTLVGAQSTALRACMNVLSSNGTNFDLVRSSKVGAYVQCEYLHDNGDGSSSGTYCFYRTADYKLTHYPNTPIRVDSNPSCPDPLPLASNAGTFLIKASDALPGKCVTMAENVDGGEVVIQDCDYRHGNPSQKWTFDGQVIKQGDKCVDVTDGRNVDGTKLQVWTCAGNANQRWMHTGGDVLTMPDDVMKWAAHVDKCVDLTDGSEVNGNQLQIWTCGASNPNQQWYLEIGK